MKDLKNFSIVEEEGEYESPKECELAELASQKLEKDNTEAHYRFINILTLTLILIFSSVLFLTVSGSDIVDNNNVLTWKSFTSGDYTRSLKRSYDSDLPFPEEMKMLEERISLIYGIGNKVSDPVKEIDEYTDTQHNSFDQPDEPEPAADNNDEKIVTSVVTDEMGITVTTEAEKDDDGKVTTTTTAIDRPDDEDETSTTTTTTAATTTNTDPPEFTVTETYPVEQPGPTTTTTTTTAETTTPTETDTEPVITDEPEQ